MPDTLTTNEKEIKQEALTIVEQSKLVKITDQPSYDNACSLLLDQIKPFRKKWKEYWDTVREPAYRAYQAVLNKFNEGDKPLEAAEKQVKSEIARWDAEQERIRQELQRKAQEEAERKEAERRLAESVFAEESGASDEEIGAIVNAPLPVAEPVEPTYARTSGISSRENWKCRVTDLKALCKAIGAGKVPVTYVTANASALNARAAVDKNTLNIPGCVAYNEPVIAGRSR